MGSWSSRRPDCLGPLPLKPAGWRLDEAAFQGVSPLLSQVTSSLTKAQLQDSDSVFAPWPLCWQAVGTVVVWLH